MPQMIDDYGSYDIPSGGGAFLKLENGENRLRLVSKAFEVVLHSNGTGKNFSTNLCQGENCELCKKGQAKKYKYAYLVISRKDGQVHVWEAPVTVFRQIVAYATNEEYGDPTQYDLTIRREGEAPQITYTVIASPKKAKLTAEEQGLLMATEVTIDKAYEATKK